MSKDELKKLGLSGAYLVHAAESRPAKFVAKPGKTVSVISETERTLAKSLLASKGHLINQSTPQSRR